MSQEHEIHTEAAPFESGYQPETLPKIQVPDLPEDAVGLSAEALAQVPTLTELVGDEPAQELAVQTAEPVPTEAAEGVPETDEVASTLSVIQEVPVQVDTWGEQLHARMGKLTDDIHTLNARLDRLEQRNNTKV